MQKDLNALVFLHGLRCFSRTRGSNTSLSPRYQPQLITRCHRQGFRGGVRGSPTALIPARVPLLSAPSWGFVISDVEVKITGQAKKPIFYPFPLPLPATTGRGINSDVLVLTPNA